MKRVSFALVIALLLATTATSVVDARTKSHVRTPMAIGASMDNSADMNTVAGFTNQMGRAPAIWSLWSAWGGSDKDFPTAAVQGLTGQGIVPMINWSPSGASQTDCDHWRLDVTIRGDYDSYLRQWAQAAKDSGAPKIVVRLAPELNGYWYIWGPQNCTNTPKKFKKFWKHVWNIFRGPGGVGATNVEFLWSVFGTYQARSLYPGDAYVDFMGLTAFNWNQDGHPRWKSMVGTMKGTVNYLHAYVSPTKPIIVAELGAGYDPQRCPSCDTAAWIRNGYPAVYNKWPQVVAMVYFNINLKDIGQPDWRLDSAPGAVAAYRDIVNDPRFQGSLP